MGRYKITFQDGQAAADTLAGVYKELEQLDENTKVLVKDQNNNFRVVRKGEAGLVRKQLRTTLWRNREVQNETE